MVASANAQALAAMLGREIPSETAKLLDATGPALAEFARVWPVYEAAVAAMQPKWHAYSSDNTEVTA